MAENIILKNVKVKHKVYEDIASLASATGEKGELLLAQVPGSEKVDPYTGKVTEPAAYIAKIGTDSGSAWLNAPASDVYEWAKKSSLGEVTEFSNLRDKVNQLAPESGEGGTGSIAGQIEAAINALDSDEYGKDDTTNPYFITSIKQTDGIITATAAETIPQGCITGLTETFAGKLDKTTFEEFKGSALIEGNEFTTFKSLSDAVYAFLNSEAQVEGVIDTLVEINKYITDHTEAFTQLSAKVTALENTVGDATKGLVKRVTDLETAKTNYYDKFFDMTPVDGTSDLTAISTAIGDYSTRIGNLEDTAILVETMTDASDKETYVVKMGSKQVDTLIIDCN